VTLKIPVHARDVHLHFKKKKRLYPIMIGDMDPIDESAGVRRRLEHLKYQPPPSELAESDQATADRHAISKFQEQNKLPITGEADEATKAALVKEHGG
jgi:Putative peptidoglycan binding domain